MPDSVTVPLLDLKAQYDTIRAEVSEVVNEVIESQWFIMGPQVSGLEEDVAAYCRTSCAIGCASGSDALMLALMAVGIEPGDEVICPSHTFFATGGMIHLLGGKPLFADIDPVTYNMDMASVREIAGRAKRLKAIIPVHLYGQAFDMDAYVALGRELGVPIIEDAAQAIGAEDATGARAGSRGDIGCFSFFPSKNLGAFGDAGICTTNNEELGDLLGLLRLHGGRPKYYHKIVGVNSRLDAIQAAVLRVKLRYLDQWTAGRQANAAFYDRAFAEHGAQTSAISLDEGGFPLRTPEPAPAPARHIYNQYVIRVPAAIRDALRDELTAKKVGTEIYYPVPLHLQECFADLGGKPGDLPHTERAADETLALPIYPELTEEQKTHIVGTIAAFIGKQAAVSTG